MAGNIHAESLETAWEDTNQVIHEIKVDNIEVTEEEDIQRLEVRPTKSGPAWIKDEQESPTPEQQPVKTRFRAPKLHDKKPPSNTAMNFPDIGLAAPDKPQVEVESKATEKSLSKPTSNPYGELEDEEEKQEVEAGKKETNKPKAKVKKSKKAKWNAINANIKIATTVEEKESSVFGNEEKKAVEVYERPKVESKQFQIKPSGTGFRNMDNKPAEGGPFGQRTGGDDQSRFKRNYESFAYKSNEAGASNQGGGWRNTDNKPVEIKPKDPNKVIEFAKNAEGTGPKKFINKNKIKPEASDSSKPTSEIQNPLKPREVKPENAKTDAWGDNVKEQKRKNAWAPINN